MARFTVEVDLAIVRPPTLQKQFRCVLTDECCAHHAELTAIYWAMQQYKACMPIGSRILDWEE